MGRYFMATHTPNAGNKGADFSPMEPMKPGASTTSETRMSKANEQPAELWLTRRDAAAIVGYSARQFDDAIRPLLESGDVKDSGARLRFWGPAVVQALLIYRIGLGH